MNRKEEILDKTNGCETKLVNGMIVSECEDKDDVICSFGTRTVGGGFQVFGNGLNGQEGYPDIECFSAKKIDKEIEKERLE